MQEILTLLMKNFRIKFGQFQNGYRLILPYLFFNDFLTYLKLSDIFHYLQELELLLRLNGPIFSFFLMILKKDGKYFRENFLCKEPEFHLHMAMMENLGCDRFIWPEDPATIWVNMADIIRRLEEPVFSTTESGGEGSKNR